jgi:hypothetical protein
LQLPVRLALLVARSLVALVELKPFPLLEW